MKKLTLDLDNLEVQSFVTGASAGIGTVRANQDVTGSLMPCGTGAACPADSGQEACGGGGEGVGTAGGNTCAAGCTLALACTGYCGTAEGTCANQSCAFTQCWGANDTCGIPQSNIGSCYWQDTCNGQTACQPGHSGGWCTQYCTFGPTCNAEGCEIYTAGGC